MKTELEEVKKEVVELREKVAYYEGLPSAEFYKALMTSIGHITDELKNKSLDFDGDPFAKSVLVLAEKSDKIMAAISKGISTYVQQEEKVANKKADKSTTKAL